MARTFIPVVVRPSLALLLSLALGACAPASRGAAPPATAKAPAPAPTPDVSGEWISGTGAEPAEEGVRVTRPCGGTVTLWRFHQDGERVGAVLVLGTSLVAWPKYLPVQETMAGTIAGETLALDSVVGTAAPRALPVRLTLSEAPRRLRGTRDGAPIWFAPLVVEEPSGCEDAIAAPERVDLSGTWLVGSGLPEPAAGQVREFRNCTHLPAQWALEQREGRIEAYEWPERFNQGIVSKHPVARVMPEASGTVDGLDVVMDGERRYRLRYDPQSGHLRGTRDGVAVWAVRRVFYTDGPCPPVP